MIKIAIIGAGMSGLSLASLLEPYAHITIFEKARGVSGRMSTRRAYPYQFDHGAQYFTVRTQAFRDFIQPMIEDGIVARWSPRYVKFDGSEKVSCQSWSEGEPRYVGVPGMNALAQHLVKDLDIHIDTKIIRLQQKDKWCLTDDKGRHYHGFDWVIVTAPSPQTVTLLPPTFKHHDLLGMIPMEACMALMLGFAAALPMDFEAAHIDNADISWLAVNSHKPGRAKAFTLLVHSSVAYADANMSKEKEAIIADLCERGSDIVGHDLTGATHKVLHTWRYANTVRRDSCSVLIDAESGLAACGDWCEGGRVEGAFLSAWHLATALKAEIS